MYCSDMLFHNILILLLSFQNGFLVEAQTSCRLTGNTRSQDLECGTLSTSFETAAAGGQNALREEMPWQAAVYTKLTAPPVQICGGSIVSAGLVISAAHCFWTEQERQLPAVIFAVTGGKLYRPFDDIMDENAQRSDLREIRIPPRFQGTTTNFQDDIALLLLSTPFTLNAYIQPVCVDFDYSLDVKHLTDGNLGKVAGWGRADADGIPSPTLQVVTIPAVDIQRCFDIIEPVFKPAITSDKFCAGYNYGGTAVCVGDGGGGFSFPENSTDGVTRYYLRGIVSAAPKSANGNFCNLFKFAIFTHIIKHEYFIKEALAQTTVVQTNQGISGTNLPSTVSTESEPVLPISPKNSASTPITITTGGNSLPEENLSSNGFPSSRPSDPDAAIEQTVKIIEDYPSSDRPQSPSFEMEVNPVIVSAGIIPSRPSDPDAEGEQTVKIIKDSPSSDELQTPGESPAEDPSTGIIKSLRPSNPDAAAEHTVKIVENSPPSDGPQTPDFKPGESPTEAPSTGIIKSLRPSNPDAAAEHTVNIVENSPQSDGPQTPNFKPDENPREGPFTVIIESSRPSNPDEEEETVKIKEESKDQSKPFIIKEPLPLDIEKLSETEPPSNQDDEEEQTTRPHTTETPKDTPQLHIKPYVSNHPESPTDPPQSTEAQPIDQPTESTKDQPASPWEIPSVSAETQPLQTTVNQSPQPANPHNPWNEITKIIRKPITTWYISSESTNPQPVLSSGSQSSQFVQSIPNIYTTQMNPDITIVNHKWFHGNHQDRYENDHFYAPPQYQNDHQHQEYYQEKTWPYSQW